MTVTGNFTAGISLLVVSPPLISPQEISSCGNFDEWKFCLVENSRTDFLPRENIISWKFLREEISPSANSGAHNSCRADNSPT